MKVDLNPITVSLDLVSRQADNQIETWLQELSPEMRQKFSVTVIGPWIKDKKLLVRLIPRLLQGPEMQNC
jgi:hypothetical protein